MANRGLINPALLTGIADAIRTKTGGAGTMTPAQMASQIALIETGITPSGTLTITENGIYDVTDKAAAAVQVPQNSIQFFEATVADDVASGKMSYLSGANDYLASIRNDPNAFVMVRYLGIAASTAELSLWVAANFPLVYTGDGLRNCFVVRSSVSACSATFQSNGLKGDNYSGNMNVAANGSLYLWPSATYPLKAGTYQIIAGTVS